MVMVDMGDSVGRSCVAWDVAGEERVVSGGVREGIEVKV